MARQNLGEIVEVGPWLLIACIVLGAGIMVSWGLPREVPLVGRADGDPDRGPPPRGPASGRRLT